MTIIVRKLASVPAEMLLAGSAIGAIACGDVLANNSSPEDPNADASDDATATDVAVSPSDR